MLDESFLDDAYEKLKRKRKEKDGFLSETHTQFRMLERRCRYMLLGMALGCMATSGFIYLSAYRKAEGVIERTRKDAKTMARETVMEGMPEALYRKFEGSLKRLSADVVKDHIMRHHSDEEVGRDSSFSGVHGKGGDNNLYERDISKQPWRYISAVNDVFRMDDDLLCVIYVDKASNLVRLVERSGASVIYNSTDGTKTGPKEREGDKRTPEGIYRLKGVTILEGSSSRSPYGAAKLEISYPNAVDIRKGRKGNGALICGTDLDEKMEAIYMKRDVTCGSVVMTDDDVCDLASRVIDVYRKTAVIIEDASRPLDMKEHACTIRR